MENIIFVTDIGVEVTLTISEFKEAVNHTIINALVNYELEEINATMIVEDITGRFNYSLSKLAMTIINTQLAKFTGN